MSLFSFLRKNEQESASGDSTFYSRAEEESKAVRNRGKRKQADNNGKGARSADPVLPEKKRARRRLIGAIALVLAAVIGLPMILDSEPRPVSSDIAIHIPPKEKAATTAESPAVSGADSKVEASASLDAKEEMVEPASPAAAPVVAQASERPSTPAKTAPEPAKSRTESAPKVELAKTVPEAPRPASQPKPEIKIEPKAAGKVDETARALALLNGKPDPMTEHQGGGKFVIQVAALATKEGVNELQTRLREAGIKSYTQKIATASGERTRIRVGPFGSKDEAEKVRAKIVKLGLNGTLVPV